MKGNKLDIVRRFTFNKGWFLKADATNSWVFNQAEMMKIIKSSRLHIAWQLMWLDNLYHKVYYVNYVTW